jgi:hypothetical protein
MEPGRDLSNLLPETITVLKKTRNGNINKLLNIQASNICLFTTVPARDDFYEQQIPFLQKFSSWKRMIIIIAYCRRWKSRRKGDITPMAKIEAE